ncbi:hypothetical protein T06_253 [Trichinella sp. T6]|nr:hypothetical protein T06_253 [Trichinella sp. T6]
MAWDSFESRQPPGIEHGPGERWLRWLLTTTPHRPPIAKNQFLYLCLQHEY